MSHSKREIAISDQWTTSKSKLAFMVYAAEIEVYALEQSREESSLDSASAWGKHYILEEIYCEMDRVIDGDMPELKEVTNG